MVLITKKNAIKAMFISWHNFRNILGFQIYIIRKRLCLKIISSRWVDHNVIETSRIEFNTAAPLGIVLSLLLIPRKGLKARLINKILI